MNVWDLLIIAAIVLVVVLALRSRRKGSGCPGCCSGCPQACDERTRTRLPK